MGRKYTRELQRRLLSTTRRPRKYNGSIYRKKNNKKKDMND